MSDANALESTLEWAEYVQAPSRQALEALLSAVRTQDRTPELIPALSRLFGRGRQWKVAQHIALLCLLQSRVSLAMYYAHQALTLSGGELAARLIYAKVLWERRLPLAVLAQTETARLQARRLKGAERQLFQWELAALNVKAYSYIREVRSARRWAILGEVEGKAQREALLRLMLSARSVGDKSSHAFAALALASIYESFGPRPRAAIQDGIRHAILALLWTRT